ncbi:hypothetical protein HPB51_024708 [Rhipicephalus microplus]|uniref:Uncharacterized protein n=1 Tax=Rhipicephalus microplus TaxID=6941 RepID=A0A9J6E420_RHIMP|nr:hypothetical protein HPB51_024708 [Rhipicephalus microplus]
MTICEPSGSTQETSAPCDVVVPVVPVEAAVPVVLAPVVVKMLSRGEQEFKEPEKARIYSQESIVVRLNNPGQQASSTAMKAKLPASVSEESGPKVNARPSKAYIGCSSNSQDDVPPMRLPGATSEDDHFHRNRHGERPGRVDAGGFAWKERAVFEKRAVLEPPVTRADGGGAVRAAPEKIAKTSGHCQPVEDAAFSHRDHMLIAVVGGGLMLGSLLIAILLLLVVSHHDKNAASVATSQEAK